MKKTFRIISFFEGISYLLLLFVAVPIKYFLGDEFYVKILGMPHGILFIGYIILAISIRKKMKWNLKTFLLNASSTCSPSRAALLTGSYPIRTGLVNVLWPRGGGFGSDNSKTLKGLNPNEITIAEVLRNEGYVTAMSGKWHLGDEIPFLPLQQGFDTYFGIPYSNDMNKEELPILLDNEILEINPDHKLIKKLAINFINDVDNDEPFFLYLAHSMPHIPIFASEKFKGKSKGGLYGDVIEEIDFNVGRLINSLKEKNIFDNTLIIFTSDNGPWLNFGSHAGSSGELRGGKFDIFEGGYRVPCVISWPNTIPAGTQIDQLVSTIDLLPTICAITGAKLPINKIDGINVLSVLKNLPMPELNNRFYYYHKSQEFLGVQQGNWKYLAPSTYNEILLPGILKTMVFQYGKKNFQNHYSI